MDEEQMNEIMEPYAVHPDESLERGSPSNKENVVLRSISGNPDRYIPLAKHKSPSTMLREQPEQTSMYTIETRYQPIPEKVLPKKTNPALYYIDPELTRESPIINEDRENPILVQSDEPVIFLEPKIISQPIFYSITGTNSTPNIDRPIALNNEPSSPTLYSIHRRPRTVDLDTKNIEDPIPINDNSPALYALVGHSNVPKKIPEPTKDLLQQSPNIYSIVGNPARTSRGTQAPVTSPVQPIPVLYTIVGDTPPSSTHRPSTPSDTFIQTLHDTRPAQKTQPISKPTLYTLVGTSHSPPEQINQSKSPTRTRTPPPLPVIDTNQRTSRRVEQKPETITEEIVTYPAIKTKRQPQPKEPSIPKSELLIIPVHDEERRSRPQISRQPVPRQSSFEQAHRKPYLIPQYQPKQLSDYQSPYTARTHKPYREQKYTHNPLPVVPNTRGEKKERPPLYEPRYRVERHHPYVPSQSISVERHPVNTKSRSNGWNDTYQTDDDDEYEQKVNKKKRNYRTSRTRAPWIPVW